MNDSEECLSPREQDLLVRLSDPDAGVASIEVPEAMRERLLDAADRHSVLAIVWRKLRGQALADAPAPVDESAFDTISQRMFLAAGQSLLLKHQGAEIAAAFADAGVRSTIVKGAVFARRIYRVPADRPFTDVDFLVDTQQVGQANEVLASRGLICDRKPVWDNSERYQEFKWTHPDNVSLLFEVHGNLVHYPLLRRRLSFGYRELHDISEGDVESPAALLATAIVHGIAGHKFHSLRLVLDVLQAARAIPESTEDSLFAGFRRLRMSFDAGVALDLAGRIYGDRRVLELAARLGGKRRSLTRAVLTPGSVLDAPYSRNGASRLRRHAFRAMQWMAR